MPRPSSIEYPTADIDAWPTAILGRLQELLTDGDGDLDGLSTSPMFRLDEDDPASEMPAPVVFEDDEAPGTPYVRIAELLLDQFEEYGRDQQRVRCEAMLEVNASDLTQGVDPASDRRSLGGAVWQIITNRTAMQAWGFRDPKGYKFQTPRYHDRESRQYTHQISFEFTAYAFR